MTKPRGVYVVLEGRLQPGASGLFASTSAAATTTSAAAITAPRAAITAPRAATATAPSATAFSGHRHENKDTGHGDG